MLQLIIWVSFNTDGIRTDAHKDHYAAFIHRYDTELSPKLDFRLYIRFLVPLIIIVNLACLSTVYWVSSVLMPVPHAIVEMKE